MNLVFLLLISTLGLAAGDPEAQGLRLHIDSPKELDLTHPLVISFCAARDIDVKNPADALDRIREYFGCPLCHEPLGSKSLSVLSCGHELHESCYLFAQTESSHCPICRNGGFHSNRDRQTDLRDALEVFEAQEWISMPKLYPDSPLPVDFADPSLEHLMNGARLGRSLLRKALANADFHGIIQIFECRYCFRHLNSQTLSILNCGHLVHEGCYMTADNICSICGSVGPHLARDRDHFYRDVLQLFELKLWISVPKIYPDSPRPVDFNDELLLSYLSLADRFPKVQGQKTVVCDKVHALRDAVIKAKASADYQPLREFFACSFCRRRYNSKSLAVLSCGHGIHNRCFMDQVALARTVCPVCGMPGPHRRRGRNDMLRDILMLFESKQWIPALYAGDRIYPDSPIEVKYNDPDLALLLHDQPRMLLKIGREIVDAVAKAKTIMLADALECPACYQRLASNNFQVLKCGHGIHETCLRERDPESPCPVVVTDILEFDFERISITGEDSLEDDSIFDKNAFYRKVENNVFIRKVLELFEKKLWIPRPVPVVNGLRNPLAPVLQTLELFTDAEWHLGDIDTPSPFAHILSLFPANYWIIRDSPKDLSGSYDVGGHREVFMDGRRRKVVVCGVCSKFMVAGIEGIDLGCSHSFHRDCAGDEFSAAVSVTCPICHGYYSSYVSDLQTIPE